jgi:hypothetical protein
MEFDSVASSGSFTLPLRSRAAPSSQSVSRLPPLGCASMVPAHPTQRPHARAPLRVPQRRRQGQTCTPTPDPRRAHPTTDTHRRAHHREMRLLRQADATVGRIDPLPLLSVATANPTADHPHPAHEANAPAPTHPAKPSRHDGQEVHTLDAESSAGSLRFRCQIRKPGRPTPYSPNLLPTNRRKGRPQWGNQPRSKPHKHHPLRQSAEVTPPQTCSTTISSGVLRN